MDVTGFTEDQRRRLDAHRFWKAYYLSLSQNFIMPTLSTIAIIDSGARVAILPVAPWWVIVESFLFASLGIQGLGLTKAGKLDQYRGSTPAPNPPQNP